MAYREFSIPGRSPVYTDQCAVATSHPLATTTAIGVLKEGGNAVDAAIAASATLAVVEPQMTGIGGDCFAIVGQPDGSLHGLNASGRASYGAELGWYLENGFSGKLDVTSPHAVTAPGALRGWEKLHQRFGSFDWGRLFADAIYYAENGFRVGERVASDWIGSEAKIRKNTAATKSLLIDDRVPKPGDKIAFPNLANALSKIANDGVNSFYQGEIAEEIANTVQSLGGFLSVDDLAATSADWVDPISTNYRGYTLHEIPPNGQGLAALVIVSLLQKFDVPEHVDSVERAHLELECARIGYAIRDRFIADPNTMNVGNEEMLDDTYIERLLAQFDPKRRNPTIQLPDPSGSDTVYLSVVDQNGLAISFINSIFSDFGSGIVTPNSGIVLQNRGSGFVLQEGHPNAIGPGKRPLHTIIPAMVTKNGAVTHAFGVMGGAYQALGHAHVLSNMLDYNMNPQEALDFPRLFWEDDGRIKAEASVSENVVSGLQELGHPVVRASAIGGGQIIQIDHQRGCLIAGSDARKDGNAAGF